MHISEGILAPEWCLVWFAITIPFIAVGVWQIKRGTKENASYLPILAMNPKIIVLDEPTSNLDPRTSSSVMHLLVDLCRRMNIALIIATHDVDAVPQYADRIYVMHGDGS